MLNLQRLKDIRKENREDQVIYNLLGTIIGECEQISKDPSHNEILKVIQKMFKDNSETIKVCNREDMKSTLDRENGFLSRFLPQPLTDDELTAIVNSQVQAGCNMSAVMKYLSENYRGRYDGKAAVRLCNIYINGTVM